MRYIPEGVYYLKIASGLNWGIKPHQSLCEGRFTEYANFKKGTNLLNFLRKSTEDGYQIPSYELRLQVSESQRGNNQFDPDVISESEFTN